MSTIASSLLDDKQQNQQEESTILSSPNIENANHNDDWRECSPFLEILSNHHNKFNHINHFHKSNDEKHSTIPTRTELRRLSTDENDQLIILNDDLSPYHHHHQCNNHNDSQITINNQATFLERLLINRIKFKLEKFIFKNDNSSLSSWSPTSTVRMLPRNLIVVIVSLFFIILLCSSPFCLARSSISSTLSSSSPSSESSSLEHSNELSDHHHHQHRHRHYRLYPKTTPSLPPLNYHSNSHQYYKTWQYYNDELRSNFNRLTLLKPEAPAYHFLHQMIRQKTMAKQRRHRHTYYSDSVPYNTVPTISPTYHSSTTRRANRLLLEQLIDSSFNSTRHNKNGRSLFITTNHQTSMIKVKTSPKVPIIYQREWIKNDDELPVCERYQVCNEIDTYSSPWIEKHCRCPGSDSASNHCPMSLNANDGHTVVERKTRDKQYKLCEPLVKLKMPTCRLFQDITYTLTIIPVSKNEPQAQHSLQQQGQQFGSLMNLITGGETSGGSSSGDLDHLYQNSFSKREMKCKCPPNSDAYLIGAHKTFKTTEGQLAYRYEFACSPEARIPCKSLKDPCRLFSVSKKRTKVEEAHHYNICDCPNGYQCPTNHRHSSVVNGTSAYCYAEPDSTSDAIFSTFENKIKQNLEVVDDNNH